MSMDLSRHTDLWNEDLAPTSAAQRTWRWYHFAALWVGMVMCIPAYTLAASLIEGGMSAYQAVFTVFLANAIVLLPMLLIGHAGTKYGIPYAVLARASFGTRGARLPALMRAIVACGWYGIQTWFGGSMIYTLLGVLAGHADRRRQAGRAGHQRWPSCGASWRSGRSSSISSCTAWMRSASSKPRPRR